MTDSRHKVLIVCNQRARDMSFLPSDLERLSAMAEWEWLHLEGGVAFGPNEDPGAIEQLIERVGDVECVVVSHGSPLISADVMDAAPNLKLIGELEGDRFAYRIDVESAWERGIRTVDTTQGSSYPVSEWALALILISLRNAGASFRSILAGEAPVATDNEFGYDHGELTGKRVGLIGCGHIGRRLVKYLQPFEVDIRVYESLPGQRDAGRDRRREDIARERTLEVRRHSLPGSAHARHRGNDRTARTGHDPVELGVRERVARGHSR